MSLPTQLLSPFALGPIARGLRFAEVASELAAALPHAGASAVVVAPPGTGKTTLVPPLVADLLADGAAQARRVLVTQPRRVAARAAARRLAALSGETLGGLVGYSVRGESKRGPGTVVEFLTTGLLLRRLAADPSLEGVGAVVLDEVHERGLDTDLLLGLLCEVRELREDLSLVAMSATADAEALAALLGTDGIAAPIVEAFAEPHPLRVEYVPAQGRRQDERGVTGDFLDHVARTAARAHAEALAQDPACDALVFLPGVREVEEVARRLGPLVGERTEVLRLAGRADAREQDRAIEGREGGGRPRIIVSTAVAESSLTVPGVRLVVDAGLSREPRRDAVRGMNGLVTVQASRASLTQRAGRANRTGAGAAVRLFDERTLAAASAHITPEILSSDLTDAALLLAAWGTPRGEGLRLLDAPAAAAMRDAEAVLRALGAVDPDGRATALGQRLAALPVDARWGRALLLAAPAMGAAEAAEIVAAATLDGGGQGADWSARLEALRSGRDGAHRSWRREAQRLERIVGRGEGRGSEPGPRRDAESGSGVDGAVHARGGMSSTAESFRPDRVDRVGWVVGLAWPERVARRVPPGSYLLASGTRAGLVGGSDEWIAVAEVTRAEGRNAAGTGAVIRSAAGLSEEAALDAAGGLLVEETTARFVGEKLSARRVRRLGAIELSSTPVKADKAAGRAAVAARLAEEGLGSLPWDEPARALRRRLGFLHRELGAPWPRMGDAALAGDAESWLGPELGILAEGKRLPKGALASALRRLLPWPEASRLDELAPERLRVPSGNTAAIEYPEPGEDGQPVVSVKLQECFGFTGTPRLAEGRAPVLFHLLSPARQPLAVTDDLASFWSGPYAQVRAEMRGRYPKHPWPENPLEATATHLTNRRLRERG